MASLEAALIHGADAVYLGASAFGARAGAAFDEQMLEAALRFAHLHQRRIYVTVNTLIKASELESATALVRKLDQLKVDALIVQDIGLVRWIKQHLPSLPLHASTQMSIHNAAGARLLLEQGISRVVLARECSLDAIRDVASTGMETEVFVHGALCVSVSGQCLLSSQIGCRSGNRGRCAQPCRLNYLYRGKEGAWLSPRDLRQLSELPKLLDAGAMSFKIEGRLKRPEYVAIVTRAYRRALDAALEGRANAFLEEDEQELLQIFNRGGFTKGHAFGEQDASLINPGQVSHEGLPIGQLAASREASGVYRGELKLSTALHHGDMLQIRSSKQQEMIYSGPTVAAGGNVSIRHHLPARASDQVWRLVSSQQLERARERVQQGFSPIPLSASLHLAPDQPARLLLGDGITEVRVEGAFVQQAKARPISREDALAAVGKTGGSPFTIDHFEFASEGDCFMPVSQLNALRREALERMESARIEAHSRIPAQQPKAPQLKNAMPVGEGLFVRTTDPDSFEALRSAGANYLLYSPADYAVARLPARLRTLGPDDYLCLPKQLHDADLAHLHGMIQHAGINVVVDNLAQLGMSWPAKVLLGAGIPAWNTEATEWFESHGVSGFVLSQELSVQDMLALQNDSLPSLLVAYGRAEVMLLNHCPERTSRGLSGNQTSCRLCDAGEGTRGQSLRDRLGKEWPILPQRLSDGCLNRLYFHQPLHLSKRAFGRRWLLDFTTEPLPQQLAVTRYYAALLQGNAALPPLDIPLYNGRLDQGVQ